MGKWKEASMNQLIYQHIHPFAFSSRGNKLMRQRPTDLHILIMLRTKRFFFGGGLLICWQLTTCFFNIFLGGGGVTRYQTTSRSV